ncbi:HupE/UreJ family protein [Bergeyella zoohelcum]|uniref:HupE / UreJ protein n=2 Tax=Bergeyella zoohelcum TaxID=1015 RepID=K1LU77_9FLAO|nr:HupE/UreJ family protein [Bergeyella zoohelcum]EKB55677.1 hypothetical protein HMPREF9699_01667 [Bergeyella zoohelcum ATCC 43767]EKB58799.1 hypothetical protein HMPREF9700_01749 [Bergeyella zoohelcum CCUG 30536]MDY6026627.1 HupE/UreJ family protein [Bergeyella zoohelcum]SUV50254.1 Uncharacterised protein [Bergeyella zoohelcum]SUV53246.1 Uncharacterised protein [Bergeyella zoohelcum]
MIDSFLLYLSLGWEHIISTDALDHQLFILALIAAFSFDDWRKLLILITAFTVGHSITLAISLMDFFRIPTAVVEFVIPVTIAITALYNIITRKKSQQLTKINYVLALVFGLVHGLGFANTARAAMSSEDSLLMPLLGFNIGLELGQIILVLVILILHFFAISLFRVNKKDWVMFISSGVFALSVQMALERWAF